MKFLFTFCCLMVFSFGIFGQNLQADLKKSFNRFSIVKINNQKALLKAKSGIPFKIQTIDRTFEFVLTENDMRSADYKSEYTDKDGTKPNPADNVVTTYKGKLTGESSSIVRMSLDGIRTEGFISTQDRQDYFIEQATKYSSKASSDDAVIYQPKDKVNNPIINFGLDGIVAQIKNSVDKQVQAQFVKASFTPFYSLAQTAMKSIEVDTDADTGFILANGGVSGSSFKIRAALGTVDGIYQRDLNLRIIIGYSHYWKCCDPYGSVTGAALLDVFRNYWNTNYPQFSWPRNVAHLFSDNYTSTDAGGIGYLGGPICKNPSYAYSVTYFYSSTGYSAIVAHEIGHGLGATHTSNSLTGCQEPGCENTLMQEQIQLDFNTFCQFSINQITNYFRPFYDPNRPDGLLCDPTLR